jgi:hypothetical protein
MAHVLKQALLGVALGVASGCTERPPAPTGAAQFVESLAMEHPEAEAVSTVVDLGPSVLADLSAFTNSTAGRPLRDRALLAVAQLIIQSRGTASQWAVTHPRAGTIRLERAVRLQNDANQFGAARVDSPGRCVAGLELGITMTAERSHALIAQREEAERALLERVSEVNERCGRFKDQLDCAPQAAAERARLEAEGRAMRRALPRPGYRFADGQVLFAFVNALPAALSGGRDREDCEETLVAIARAVATPIEPDGPGWEPRQQ